MVTELDFVQKMRMCVAEVGGNVDAITYPNEEQKARGCDFVYDSSIIDFKIVWQASQIQDYEEENVYVCWACILPHQYNMTPGVWESVAERCKAWRPSTQDCGKNNVN